jgi:hypothetical protein
LAPNPKKTEKVYMVVSDLVDDSLERVVKLAQQGLKGKKWVLKLGLKRSVEIKKTITDEGISPDLIIFYASDQKFSEEVVKVGEELDIPVFDIFDPVFRIIDVSFHEGITRAVSRTSRRDYLKLIEAIEFAGKHDDGKNIDDIGRADLVLIGVSRTSKTPLSLYLANMGLKVANVPIVYGVEPPEILFKIPRRKIVGLTISPSRLYKIRKYREAELGIHQTSYSSLEAIEREVLYAEEIMHRLNCLIIDVTQKAIEESAEEILKHLGKEES